jgi:CMP-N-acetylneuraminic acid synthetase
MGIRHWQQYGKIHESDVRGAALDDQPSKAIQRFNGMSEAQKKVLGFVAFREGSRRLPMKNGACIGGKPLYQIALDKLVALMDCGMLDAVVASTDSMEWAGHCREIHGDRVIVHERSSAVSGSGAGEGEVIAEFFSLRPEYADCAVLLLLCTYPFMKRSVLIGLIEKYRICGESVFAVVESHHMPQKLLKANGDSLLPYFCDSFDEFEPNTKILKEHFPPAYHTTGAFLVAPGGFASGRGVWDQPSICYVADDSFHVDIDTVNDLEMARLRYEATGRWE